MTVTNGTDSSPAGPDPHLADIADVELLCRVRAGQDDAFGELFVRHAAAVRGFALRCCSDVSEAEDMAAEAFFRVFQAVRRGSGPRDNVRAYLITVVRRLAAEWRTRRRDVPVADDELGRQMDADVPAPVSAADVQLIARAFSSLPRRWRAVLWRVEVEGERPAVVARHFGLSANATAALARRARQGLRAAYLQAHLAPSGGANGCRTVVAKLGGFTAGQVSGTEAVRIRQHLGACPACRALHAELLDVCAGLRRYASAAPLVGAGLAWHGGLTGGLGKLAVHAAALGTRLKFVVAAVSMAAVGGAGVAAGPLIVHLSPSPNADRGVVVAPELTMVTSVTPPVAGPRRHTFSPTMHGDLRGLPIDALHHAVSTSVGIAAAVATTNLPAPGTTGGPDGTAQPPDPGTPAGPPAAAGQSKKGKAAQLQAQSPATSNTDGTSASTRTDATQTQPAPAVPAAGTQSMAGTGSAGTATTSPAAGSSTLAGTNGMLIAGG